jgi:hypothetical protein
LRLRFTTEAQARTKNGPPAHSTTGVAKAHCSQMARSAGISSCRRNPGRWPPISSTTTGTVSAVVRRDRQGLQCHAADRAGPGAIAEDLRMHRAGVGDPAGRGRCGFLGRWAQVALRFGDEFLPASRRAEMPFGAGMRVAMPRGRRIDLHAADRVGHSRGRG